MRCDLELKNYYEILGIDENFTPEDLKKAYRSLSKKYHPDINKDNKEAEEKFKEISEAYSILSDPQKKNEYDMQRKFSNSSPFGDQSNYAYEFFRNAFGNMNFEFDWNDIRGQQTFNQKPEQPPLKVNIKISFKDSFFGATKNVSFDRKIACTKCEGTGSKEKKIDKCSKCNGIGTVQVSQRFNNTNYSMMSSIVCDQCNGKAINNPKDPCEECDGNSFKIEKTNVSINLPSGIEEGAYFLNKNQGNYKAGFGKSDLIIVISEIINDTEYFKIQDAHLGLNYKIDLLDILGKEKITIPYIDGTEIELSLKDRDDIFIEPFVIPRKGYKNIGHFVVRLNLQLPNIESEEKLNEIKKILNLEDR